MHSIIVREICVKTILSKSGVFDYTINPYVGCQHACTYCYARFMKRFTGHKELWGEFVDVKINAASLLQKEIKKKKPSRVWISGVCDPYQPLEKKYELTRECLQILLSAGWPVTIQTKSPLILRDKDLLALSKDVEVIITIPTADDTVRRIFEPKAPAITERIRALEMLQGIGIKITVMIAPLLPGAELLISEIKEDVLHVLVDKMNYNYANRIYREHKLEHAMTDEFFNEMKELLTKEFKKYRISHKFLF